MEKVEALFLPVNEAHGVDSVQSQHHLSGVKAGPLLWDIVVAHQVNQVAAGHVFHHHVEVAVILECKKELQNREEKKYIIGTMNKNRKMAVKCEQISY